MDGSERDRLLIETHTNVVEMKRQIETLFKKLNGVDERFRRIDDRCARRGEFLSGVRTRLVFLWIIVFTIFGAFMTALVRLFLF